MNIVRLRYPVYREDVHKFALATSAITTYNTGKGSNYVSEDNVSPTRFLSRKILFVSLFLSNVTDYEQEPNPWVKEMLEEFKEEFKTIEDREIALKKCATNIINSEVPRQLVKWE